MIRKFEVLFCSETVNYIQFRAQHCQNYASHQNKLEIKVVQNLISSKKVRKRICLSATGVELGGSKDFKLFLMRCVFLAAFSLLNYTSYLPILRAP